MVNPYRALVAGLKAATQSFPVSGSGSWWRPSGGWIDTRKIGNGLANSIVGGCLRVLSTKFPEAPPVVYEDEEGGESQIIFGHSASKLLRRPNPYMTWGAIASYGVMSGQAEGDVYLLVIRNAAGEPVSLWPLNPNLIEIKTPQDGSEFISRYDYSPQGRPLPLTPVEDIIHLKPYGLDHEDYRHGYAPLKTVLKEVLTDEEASQFSAALLTNLGIPGVVVSPKDKDSSIGEAQAIRMQETFRKKFTGRNRGEPYISSGAVDIKVLAFTPEQMNLTELRRIPEERVSAATGVPAILAGLGAGLERATYANVKELRESMTEDTLVPTWAEWGEQLTVLFFEPNYDPPPNQRIGFDLSKVRALQDDRDKLVTRWGGMVDNTIATVGEGRAAMGLEVTPEHDVYLMPAGKVALSLEALVAESQLPALDDPDKPDPDDE